MYGAYIRAAREKARLTPAEAAALVGYDTPDMIYKIEKDKANASIEMLDRLADAYGVRIGDLLPNSGAGPINDRFEPLMASMFGLPEQDVDEMILRLSEIARQFRGWRLREPVQPRPEATPERGKKTDKAELPVGM